VAALTAAAEALSPSEALWVVRNMRVAAPRLHAARDVAHAEHSAQAQSSGSPHKENGELRAQRSAFAKAAHARLAEASAVILADPGGAAALDAALTCTAEHAAAAMPILNAAHAKLEEWCIQAHFTASETAQARAEVIDAMLGALWAARCADALDVSGFPSVKYERLDTSQHSRERDVAAIARLSVSPLPPSMRSTELWAGSARSLGTPSTPSFDDGGAFVLTMREMADGRPRCYELMRIDVVGEGDEHVWALEGTVALRASNVALYAQSPSERARKHVTLGGCASHA
jgi:hypothetical protein